MLYMKIIKEESEKFDLKLSIQKTKIMASGPIASWEIDGETVETCQTLLKSRDITLPTKVHLSQSYVFSSGHAWMWELDCEESWASKNWYFWTVVLEKTLESS